jgi:hypothetical protein
VKIGPANAPWSDADIADAIASDRKAAKSGLHTWRAGSTPGSSCVCSARPDPARGRSAGCAASSRHSERDPSGRRLGPAGRESRRRHGFRRPSLRKNSGLLSARWCLRDVRRRNRRRLADRPTRTADRSRGLAADETAGLQPGRRSPRDESRQRPPGPRSRIPP